MTVNIILSLPSKKKKNICLRLENFCFGTRVITRYTKYNIADSYYTVIDNPLKTCVRLPIYSAN